MGAKESRSPRDQNATLQMHDFPQKLLTGPKPIVASGTGPAMGYAGTRNQPYTSGRASDLHEFVQWLAVAIEDWIDVTPRLSRLQGARCNSQDLHHSEVVLYASILQSKTM